MPHLDLPILELIGVSQIPIVLMPPLPQEMAPPHTHLQITKKINFSASFWEHFSFFLRITYCSVSHSWSKCNFLIINLPFHHLPFLLFMAFAHFCSIFPLFKSNSDTELGKCTNLSQYFHFFFQCKSILLACPNEMLQFLHYVFHSLRNKKNQAGFLVLWSACKEKQGKCFNEGLAFLRSSTQTSASCSVVRYCLLNGRPLNTSCVHYLSCSLHFKFCFKLL